MTLGCDASVILVSFNDNSPLAEWEKSNPTAALCRRIVFEARCDRTATFDNFVNLNVTENNILEWLNETNCILLIDELNVLLSDSSANNSSNFSLFVKNTFLKKSNRYFAFSSHIVGTTDHLMQYMDSVSNRNVLLVELPLVNNVYDAATIFKWDDLSAKDIICYGFIPSLIYEAYLNKTIRGDDFLPFGKRGHAINLCLTKGLVTNDSVVALLSSFITGAQTSILHPLHELMSTAQKKMLRWIPFHMTEVLRIFAKVLTNAQLKMIVESIVSLFDKFFAQPNSSDKAWEDLFLIVLLIRLATTQWDPIFLPLNISGYSISLNTNITHAGKPYGKIDDVYFQVKCMETPKQFPHVSVYYPNNAGFNMYDVVLAVYHSKDDRDLYGYQLKEGKKIPKKYLLSNHFKLSVLVRGQPAKKITKKIQQGIWLIPNEEQNKSFLGESGQHWTPSVWRKLLEKNGKKCSSLNSDYENKMKGG
jgi:hypothetical protein